MSGETAPADSFTPLAFGTIPSMTVYDDGSSDFRLPATPDLLDAIGSALNDPEVTVVFLVGTTPKEKS